MITSAAPLVAVMLMLFSTDSHDPIRTDFSAYAWPTSASRAITSSFGEYRLTHFHAGIDISTRDEVGQPVTAAREGDVVRILVSPTGYGKLLAVRHDDGYTTVYAHLSRFNDLMERRVRKEQRRLGCYPVDINPLPGQIRVRQGELIAYSGDTGSGSAHLHFEIRDGRGRAVNPLFGGNLFIEDSIAPEIRGIALVPIGQGSLVDNRWFPAVKNARPSGKTRYTIADQPRVQGDVGLAVDVRDRSNESRFKHGVYSVLLSVDGREIQSLRFNRVPVDEGHTIGLTYADQIPRNRRCQKLFVDVPHGLEIYTPDSTGSGIIRTDLLSEGAHRFAIVCKDYRGNASTLEGPFLVIHEPPASRTEPPKTVPDTPVPHFGHRNTPVPRLEKGHTPALRLEHGEGFVRVVVENVESPDGTQAEVNEGRSTYSIPLKQISPAILAGSFVPSANFAGTRRVTVRFNRQSKQEVMNESWDILPLVPGTSNSFLLDEGRVRVEYGPQAVYAPLFVRYWREGSGESNIYRFEPGRAVLDEGFTVSVRRTSGKTKEALFLRPGRNWSLLRTTGPDTGSWITGHMHRFLGDIAALRDEEPPTIGGLRINSRTNRRPLISFRFRDNLAGIEYQKVKLYIDSVMTIPEIDGEHARVFCVPDSSLERGSHQLSIRLEDKMGNVALFGRTFNVH
jgi:hypothetical protein